MRLRLRRRGALRLTLSALIAVAGSQAVSLCPTFAAVPSAQASASPQPPAATPAGQPISPEAISTLRGWIDAGSLSVLKWPNFSDCRTNIQNFYGSTNYTLTWMRDSHPTLQALAVIATLQAADDKGLSADDYDGGQWPGRIAQMQRPTPAPSEADLAQFDLALTVCVMRYISDLHVGKVNPKNLKFGLDVEHKPYDLPQFLRERLIAAQVAEIKIALDDLEPPFDAYRRVEQMLDAYETLAKQDSGEQLPAPAKSIKPGETYPGLVRLASLLRETGDLPANAAVNLEPPLYQEPLISAVQSFQTRHGLEADGRLGKGTVAQLNVPLSHRVEQLRLVLERWRWIPHEFSSPPVLVNIPEFMLRCWNEKDQKVLEMPVVVGRSYHHKTPVFSGDMKYVVFRPYWNVPPSIQRSEMVPKIRRDAGYVAKNNLEVVTNGGIVVTDGTVSADVLAGLAAGSLSIRQKPGPKNSLGLVKFIFPNDYNVYLHSTPATELFSRSRRDFSHGCIRVQDPVGLAVWVLRDKSGWDRDRILAAMNDGDPTQVNLDKPTPVLILYGTAAVKPDGRAYFFDDIYGYDSELEQTLAKGYPYPQ
ncbi:MAG TPA: L,D-transpeptidase family protein [Candidatus Binataceae bacterium]